MEYVVGHLLSSMPTNPRGPAALAVVAVDNEQVAAGAVVSLAVSYASQGKQVVVADLSSGTRVGHHLGTGKSGVHEINVKGAHLVVVIPDSEDIAPVGPLHANMSLARHESASEALIDAYSSADLLVTLITLDPAFGGDHLATWATDAVAIVTAGRSSAVRIHAIGEMIRLAGTMLGSAVLIEADKRDESLGMAYAGDPHRCVHPLSHVLGKVMRSQAERN
jgi:hypothetical protein